MLGMADMKISRLELIEIWAHHEETVEMTVNVIMGWCNCIFYPSREAFYCSLTIITLLYRFHLIACYRERVRVTANVILIKPDRKQTDSEKRQNCIWQAQILNFPCPDNFVSGINKPHAELVCPLVAINNRVINIAFKEYRNTMNVVMRAMIDKAWFQKACWTWKPLFMTSNKICFDSIKRQNRLLRATLRHSRRWIDALWVC